MAETIGSLVDKLSIIELKIYHMREQLERKDASAEHKSACERKLLVMAEQKQDLNQELTQLYNDVTSGKRKLKVYRQFKMYNDPAYRSSQKIPS